MTSPGPVDKLVFLIRGGEATPVMDLIRGAAPDLPWETVSSLDALRAAATPRTRVISIGSPIIVPADILDGLRVAAYNIHPGPPEYPGIFPSVFALYDGATTFGVTLHEMAAKVDTGPIVAVDRFDVTPAMDRAALDAASYRAILALVAAHAERLATLARLPALGAAWGPRAWTRKDFDALCKLPADVDADEFARRHRAIGEGPEHALEITVHGVRFVLDRGQTDKGPVTRGGQIVEDQ